ncbi:hypothetical protein RRG08_011269 [Elysia crispata]|uniref:Band 7 domain-containing protein n=1 Tax=Elysia crispata TaxID=231223 RepID=A0AAE1CTF7_9GAST|nr:hypothetical protein RRG08_011269 [Elysia crispata]
MGFETCGPNEVMIVSGFGRSKPIFVCGGWVFVWPKLQRLQRLSLNVITLSVESLDVRTSDGIVISVKGLAQVKVFGDVPELLERAAENFLGKSEEEIGDTVKETLQGHQRSVIVNMNVEDIYFDREQVSKTVFETAAPDLGRMGICIVSYTVPDVWDGQGHLKSLCRERAERTKGTDQLTKD